MIYKDVSTAFAINDARTAALFFDHVIPIDLLDLAQGLEAGVVPSDSTHPDVAIFQQICRAIALGTASPSFGYREMVAHAPFDSVVFGAPHLPAGPADAVDPCLVLSELNLIDGAALTWDQVAEIRKDRASLDRLRNLRRVVYRDYSGKPETYIRDDIAFRIDQYEQVTKFWNFPVAKGLLEIAMAGEAAPGVTVVAAPIGL